MTRLIKTSTSTPHLNCKNKSSDFLVSQPMTINIQNRQHIRLFSPFNSVKAAIFKVLPVLSVPVRSLCLLPSKFTLFRFSVCDLFAISFASFLNYFDALNGYRSLPSPPRPIPSPEPNLIKSQRKCFAKFTNEFKQNQTTMQTT